MPLIDYHNKRPVESAKSKHSIHLISKTLGTMNGSQLTLFTLTLHIYRLAHDPNSNSTKVVALPFLPVPTSTNTQRPYELPAL